MKQCPNPNCKSLNPDYLQFCDFCGTRLSGTETDEGKLPEPKYGTKTPGASAPTYTPAPAPTSSPANVPNPMSPGGQTGKLPWYKRLTINLKREKESWMQRLLRKCIVATIVTLIIAVLLLIIKIWPGCLISAALLLFAIATTIFSILIQVPDITEEFEGMTDEKVGTFLNHILNMILIWEGFWLAAGLVCLAFTWWAVLIAEIINILGLLIIIFGTLEDIG